MRRDVVPVFTRMRDNVLVFTEDHSSPNLAELAGYFAGYLHIDGRDLRQRLAALADWHAVRLRSDAEMRRAAQLLGAESDGDARELLTRAGWISYVASRPGYDSRTLLPPRLVQVWESLLIRLKEFELLTSNEPCQ